MSTQDDILDRLSIEAGSRIVDVGFGNSQALLVLLRLVGDTGMVFGVERSKKSVSRAIEELAKVKNVRISVGDVNHLPAPDDSADVVLFKGVLHEVHSPDRALSEAKRVCKSGGRIVIIDFSEFPETWLRKSNLRWRIRNP
jgi:arsenite methyltransferase